MSTVTDLLVRAWLALQLLPYAVSAVVVALVVIGAFISKRQNAKARRERERRKLPRAGGKITFGRTANMYAHTGKPELRLVSYWARWETGGENCFYSDAFADADDTPERFDQWKASVLQRFGAA